MLLAYVITAGIIRAGLRPSSAMSTMNSRAESSPSSWRSNWALPSGTATNTASPRARLAWMKPVSTATYSLRPW